MSGARSRRKGAQGERRAVKLLEAITEEDWRRAAVGDDQPLGDVVCAAKLGDPWGTVFVEVKAHRACRAEHLLMPTQRELDWWSKAKRQAQEVDRWPLLVVWLHGRGGVLVSERWLAPELGENVEKTWGGRTDWGQDNVRLCGVSL